MGESFELQKKLTKVRDELRKREVNVRGRLADIEKKKVEALKEAEEMKHSALHDIEKIDESIMKLRFDNETKTKLTSEITTLKTDIEKKYTELRSTILGKTSSA